MSVPPRTPAPTATRIETLTREVNAARAEAIRSRGFEEEMEDKLALATGSMRDSDKKLAQQRKVITIMSKSKEAALASVKTLTSELEDEKGRIKSLGATILSERDALCKFKSTAAAAEARTRVALRDNGALISKMKSLESEVFALKVMLASQGNQARAGVSVPPHVPPRMPAGAAPAAGSAFDDFALGDEAFMGINA